MGGRRAVPDGLRRLLSRGAARPPGGGGRVLGRPPPGHQRPVPPLRQGHRLCDRGRAAPRPGRLPRRRPGPAGPGGPGVPAQRRAGRPARLAGLVGVGPRGQLAEPGGARVDPARPRPPPRRPGLLPGRPGVRLLGRQGAAQRGRVGVRGQGRPGGQGVRLGGRVRPQGPPDGQHLAGRVPLAEPAAGPVRADLAGGVVPAQRLRAGRHGRQRLGVDQRPLHPRPQATESCCAPHHSGEAIPRRVIKGGSHLCAPSYCLRYRPAARQGEAVDTATTHIGFRCVLRDAPSGR